MGGDEPHGPTALFESLRRKTPEIHVVEAFKVKSLTADPDYNTLATYEAGRNQNGNQLNQRWEQGRARRYG
jgi:hypothetical protein